MCFSEPKSAHNAEPAAPYRVANVKPEMRRGEHQHAVAYKINRARTGFSQETHHWRTRSSLERHQEHAGLPGSAPRMNNYPKRFGDSRSEYEPDSELWEYPSKPYGYGGAQASGGNTKTVSSTKMPRTIDPGHTRTITGPDGKRVRGVQYHPKGNPRALWRADEAWVATNDGELNGIYAYPENCKGAPNRIGSY